MIELTKLEWELKKYVEIAYRGDMELLSEYHIAEYSFNEAVEETLAMIYETSLEVEMKYCGVVKNNKIIGYLCYFDNNLYSFGINIEYRTKEVLSEFWERIKETLGDSFICMLFPNNIRAIKFLQRCGMKIIDGVEESAVTLLYHNKIETLCPG